MHRHSLLACTLHPGLIAALLTAGTIATGATGNQPPPVGAELVFAERDGLVAFEAEHFFRQERAETRAWHVVSEHVRPTVQPDPDEAHLDEASGGAYIEILPDTRTTHDDLLQPGENFSNRPGELAVISYQIHFTNPGRYYVWARAYSTGTEDNGVHFGLNGRWPESGQRWQTVQKHAWAWDSRQRTEEVHVGVPGLLFLDVDTPGVHVVQVSMREDGFELDRILLTSDPDYRPEDQGPATVLYKGALPERIMLPDLQPHDRGGQIVVQAAETPLEGTGFYLDRGRWAAIHPDERTEATVTFPAPVTRGRYHLRLEVVGEDDGSSTFHLRLAGRLLGSFTPPLASEMFAEGPEFTVTFLDVPCEGNDQVELRAHIGSTDGKEWSRARWSRLVFTPADGSRSH